MRKKLTVAQSYQHWIETVKKAKDDRMNMEKAWRRWYNIVDDNLWGGGRAADGHAPSEINQLASILENTIPGISFRAGVVEVRAFAMANVTSAAIWEKVGQWILNKQGVVDELQQCIYDALVLGNGLLKLGHSVLPQLSEPQWNSGLASERAAGQTSVYGMYWPLFEFYPDPSAMLWKRQRFFIHQYDKHIDEIQGNPLYDSKQANKIKPTRGLLSNLFKRKDEHDNMKDYVAMQEIYDLVEGRLLIVSDAGGSDGFLYNDVAPFGMIPMEQLRFFNRPMNVWGKGITQTIEQHLIDLSKIDDYGMSILRKDALTKIAVDASAGWTPKNIEKLKESGDTITALNSSPAGSFEVLQLGASAQTFTYERNRQMKMATIRELAGVGRMQQGLHEPGVNSATESATLQQNADVITQWRANLFSEFVGRALEKMIYIVSVTYSPVRIAQMVGLESDTVSAVIRGEPYNPSKYILKYGQAALADSADRRAKFNEFMAMFGPAVNPAIAMRMAADILDIEYTDEMLVPGAFIGGQPSQSGGGEAGTAGFRPPESQGG